MSLCSYRKEQGYFYFLERPRKMRHVQLLHVFDFAVFPEKWTFGRKLPSFFLSDLEGISFSLT